MAAECISPNTEQFSTQYTQSRQSRKRKNSDDLIARKEDIKTSYFQNSSEESEDEEIIYSSESEDESSYEVVENNYSMTKLQQDLEKMRESKEYRELKDDLLRQMKEKYPERLRKL